MATFTYEWLERNGRLGNQLWQIAWQYGQATKTNGSLSIKSDWEYRPFFSVPDRFFEAPKGPVADGKTLYYQELHHWDGLEYDVWNMFQPSPEAIVRQAEYLPEVNERDDTCSVHYRMGDYLNHPESFPVPSKTYYQGAMERVLDLAPDTKFFVFSDDIPAVRNMWEHDDAVYAAVLDEGNVEFVEGTARPVEVCDRIGEPTDWLDLFSMMNCDQHIIANSTFSWWGAYLAENMHAYYPSVWWGPALAGTPWREGIPEHWTEVKV